jgi:hypothetical protein
MTLAFAVTATTVEPVQRTSVGGAIDLVASISEAIPEGLGHPAKQCLPNDDEYHLLSI